MAADPTPAVADAADPKTEEDAAAARAAAAVDIGFGLFFVALSAAALFWLIPAQVSTQVSGTDVSPAFIPRLSASVVLVLSVMMVVQRLLRARPAGGGVEGRRLAVDTAALALGAMLVMAGLMTVGFLPTAAGMIVAGGFVARHRPRYWLIPLAMLFPLLVDLVAWQVFWVDLP